MATEQNKYESLLSRVAELKERFNSGSFFKYWELCGEFLKTSTVNDFYIYDKIDATDDFFGATYFNLVIFTDWSLVEVEGVATLREDVQFDGSDGNLSILPLNVISAIDLHLGPVETVKSSARSMLVVLLDIIGSDRIFRYWHADTYEQYQELLNFSTALMEGIKTTSTA